MNRKTIIALVALVLFGFLCVTLACTEQQRAKKFGGDTSIELPLNKKLVTATWKDSDLWYLVRDARPGEKPETYQFVESSSWGVFEGTIIFTEVIKRE